MKQKSLWQQLYGQRYSYIFIAPTVLLFLVFVVIPVVASLFLSFTEYNVIHAPKWVGLANYQKLLFNDPRFLKAVKNTIFYVLAVVPVGISLSLLLAIAIDQKIRFKNLFKTLFFIPSVTSLVAVSVVWRWLYTGGKYGLVNHLLLILGFEPLDWLMSPQWILPAIMIMSIWAGLGINMILFLAGLQTIPDTLYEVADIDGAGPINKFWHITLPLLRPTMVYAVIMSTIASFQVFEQVYIITAGTGGVGGVLDGALTIVAYLYDAGFARFMMGYASAIAYVLFAVIFVITLINFRVIRTKFEY